MIYLSASAIKDYLDCPKRYYYRRFFKSEAVPTEALSIGTVVHDTLEKFWTNKDEALEHAKSGVILYNISEKGAEKIYKQINNFFESFSWMLSPLDSVELNFSIPYQKGVKLIGKMDRITNDNLLIDWKTGKSLPSVQKLSTDPQFILYEWAYERLFEERPASTFYASLENRQFVKYERNKNYEQVLMNEIIPNVISEINKGHYHPSGFYRYYTACRNCPYKEVCFDELAGRNPLT